MARSAKAGRTGTGRRALVAAVALAVVVLALAGASARADTAALTVTTTAGASDPAAGVPRIFTLTGVSSLPGAVYVAYRAPGGAPCAPSASSDSGQGISPWDRSVNGAFRFQSVVTWQAPGDVMFCIWIARSSSAIATPITQVVTFRAPVAAVSGTVTPVSPQRRERATVTITGSSEVPASLFATIRPAGAACAPSASSDSGQSIAWDRPVNGAFSEQAEVTQQAPGNYVICLWLASSSSSPTPVAGPQAVAFTVLAPPPPPCVVPAVSRGSTSATATRALSRGRCKVRVRKVWDRRVARGRVVKLGRRAGTRLANAAVVDVYVSKGKPPRRRGR